MEKHRADDLAAMTAVVDGWKASFEGQAYNQEVYMVAIYELIGFVENTVPDLDITFLYEALSHVVRNWAKCYNCGKLYLN